jgi:predicted ABC-type ATPase
MAPERAAFMAQTRGLFTATRISRIFLAHFGSSILLIYVILETPDLNVERVQLRVRKGGHGVPAEKIRERWVRSLRQLPWFLNQADWALIFDNSRKLRIVGRKMRGTVTLDPGAPSVIREAVEKIRRLSKP